MLLDILPYARLLEVQLLAESIEDLRLTSERKHLPLVLLSCWKESSFYPAVIEWLRNQKELLRAFEQDFGIWRIGRTFIGKLLVMMRYRELFQGVPGPCYGHCGPEDLENFLAEREGAYCPRALHHVGFAVGILLKKEGQGFLELVSREITSDEAEQPLQWAMDYVGRRIRQDEQRENDD